MWGKNNTAKIRENLGGTSFTVGQKPRNYVVQPGAADETTAITSTPNPSSDDPFDNSSSGSAITPLSTNSSFTKVVLDSGAFISGCKIENLGADVEYYTIEEVVSEIKDERARHRFQTFPFAIRVVGVTVEAIRFVSDFAKQTGDFYSLSITDLKILALTYMLEAETHGHANIRKFDASAFENLNNAPKGDIVEEEYFNDCSFAEEDTINTFDLNSFIGGAAEEYWSTVDVPLDENSQPIYEVDELDLPTLEYKAFAKPEQIKKEKIFSVPGFDDGRWITPENVQEISSQTLDPVNKVIQQVAPEPEIENVTIVTGETTIIADETIVDETAKTTSTTATATTTTSPPKSGISTRIKPSKIRSASTIGCITTDFGMQNVLLQSGMRVIAAATGRSIDSLRQWMNRCHACYTLTRDMSRQFCPSCGGFTLNRIAVFANARGKVVYKWANHVVTQRGTRYAIPKPKGGKNNTDLKLREDVMSGGIDKMVYLSKQKNLDMKSNFEAGAEFAWRKSTLVDPGTVFGYGRVNPNEIRIRRKKK